MGLTVDGDQIRDIVALPSQRAAIPPMPGGVRLARWDPKPAAMALTRVKW